MIIAFQLREQMAVTAPLTAKDKTFCPTPSVKCKVDLLQNNNPFNNMKPVVVGPNCHIAPWILQCNLLQ